MRFCDDIILCDGGSTDATLEIAKEYGCRVIAQDAQFKNAEGRLIDFGSARNQVLAAAKNDWFLYIDSDETISDGLAKDVQCIARKPYESDEPLAYRIPIRIVLDGTVILHASNYPGYQYRFFNRRARARYIKPVHERINIDPKKVPTGTLANPWYVYATREDSRHYLRNTAGYRALEVGIFEHHTFSQYLRFVVFRNLRTSAGALIRSLGNYLRYGFKYSAPVSEELGRVIAPLLSIAGITKGIVRYRLRRNRP